MASVTGLKSAACAVKNGTESDNNHIETMRLVDNILDTDAPPAIQQYGDNYRVCAGIPAI